MRGTTQAIRGGTPVALDQRDLDLVRAILDRHGVATVHQPVIFGSRATGQARRFSDLDLGFAGEPVPAATLSRLRADLEESDLPIAVDVLNLADAGPALREHALRAAVPLAQAIGRAVS